MNLVLQRECLILLTLLLHMLVQSIVLAAGLDIALPQVEIIQLFPIAGSLVTMGLLVIYLRGIIPSKLFSPTAPLRRLCGPVVAGLFVAVLIDSVIPHEGLSSPRIGSIVLPAALAAHVLLQFAIAFIMRRRRSKESRPHIVIVGNNQRSQSQIDRWLHQAVFPIDLLGYFDESDHEAIHKNPGQATMTRLGDTENIQSYLMRNVVDEIWMTLPLKSKYDEINQIVRTCETIGVPVRVSPSSMFSCDGRQVKQSDGHWADDLSLVAMPGKPWKLLAKRLIDIFGSALLLVLLAPLLALIALAIKVTSKGPVFYCQTRCGLHGRRFKLYKFRSMKVNADKLLDQLTESNEHEGPIFKMKRDPRITLIGRYLRKLSLDELPQLWNTLCGEMSLVGPRPPVPEEVVKYEPWHLRRLSVKPGLTCTWQVSGRSQIGFDDWMRMDLEYIRTWSLRKDFLLVLKTIPAVLLMKGAY